MDFQKLLEVVEGLPEEERQKLFWTMRKQEAYKDSARLDDIIFRP